MANVKIVTDSNAFFADPNLIAELDLEVIPLTIRNGATSYPEESNVADDALFRKLELDHTQVSIEAPTASQVRGIFSRLGKTADAIVCIHVSSALNDIADVVAQAAKSFAGRQRIVVLDTGTTSIGLGLIVAEAGRAAAAGSSLDEVVRIVRGMIPHVYAMFFSNSLEYLEAWGRLGSAQAKLGAMLGLKPLATMEDGDLLPVEKVRNYSRAVDKLYDFIIEFSRIEQLYIVQYGFEEEAAQLLERLEVSYPRRDFPVIGYPPSLAVHIGPKALGVMVYEGIW